MHIDEKVELKEHFLQLLSNNGWNDYILYERSLDKKINIIFRLLHIIVVITIIAIAFAAMRQYIPKNYGFISLGLVGIWMIIERININKLFLKLAKKEQTKLVKKIDDDKKFIDMMTMFEDVDVLPEKTMQYLITKLANNENDKVIELIKKTLFYLQSVKSLEEDQYIKTEKLLNIEEIEEINNLSQLDNKD